MNNHKYVGLDVHLATTIADVQDASGKSLLQSFIPTRADAIRDFFLALQGTIHVTFEECTQSSWLYELIKPMVAELIVCDPRHNSWLLGGNKSDTVDAGKLAHLLRANLLRQVHHDQPLTRTLKELTHNYDCLVSDATRCMNRIKAIFRGRGEACSGDALYSPTRRDQWLEKLEERGRRVRAASLYKELDLLLELREDARKQMLAESRKHKANKIIKGVPGIGPIRAAQIIATAGTPLRFRTKRQLWAYCGLAVVTRTSAEYKFIGTKLIKRSKPASTRGLNRNYNRRLKRVFKSAAVDAIKREPFKQYYAELMARGAKPEMARLSVARKLAAIVLAIWKKGEEFSSEMVMKGLA